MDDTWLRRVDPLLKIGALSVYIFLVFLWQAPVPLASLAAGTAVLLWAARGGGKTRLMGYWLAGIGVLAAVHALLGGQAQAIGAMALRLFVFLGTSAALMLSTDPAHLLRALRRLPLPAGMLLGLSVMWRSLPVLRREVAAISQACRLEGVRLGPSRPGAVFRYLLVPLVFSLTAFADDLSLSLVSRGITLDSRPLSEPFRPNAADGLFLLILGGASTTAAVLHSWPFT